MPMTTEPSASFVTGLEGNLRQATDEVLTLAARSGNGPAFVELSGRHSKKIQLHVYRILSNWEDAEDVVQESLLKAFKHLGQFRGTCSFSSWLTRIAINSALMLLRRRRVRLELHTLEPPTQLTLRNYGSVPIMRRVPNVCAPAVKQKSCCRTQYYGCRRATELLLSCITQRSAPQMKWPKLWVFL
jgi:hypothetical protein